MMRTVHLHGRLAKVFGKQHRLSVSTAGEVFRAFNVNFPGRFLDELKLGSYRVIRGRKVGGMDLQLDWLNTLNLGDGADLHIVPVVAGSKKGGALKAILGVAIIGAAIFMSGGTLAAPLAGLGTAIGGTSITYGNIAMIGLAAALIGVSSALSPKDKPAQEVGREDSFSFAGPMNTNEQGNPIPLIFGEVITGSQPISVGSDVFDIPVGA